MLFLLLSLTLSQGAPPLRIVVLDGEGAVNIVQQNTAVRPLVEVRDRNNLPVPGASVTFTVGTGQPATFAGGAQTVTVTTNATGQAAATGFNATGAGKISIQVQAAHQGQIASAAITQTNFATVAAATAAGVTVGAATAAGTAGAGAGVAAGAGAGAGGGISATTIAIIGGAVAGGAVVAQQTGVIGGGAVTYTGTLTGQYVRTSSFPTGGEFGGPAVCNHTRGVSGTMTIELNDEGTSGRATLRMTHTDLSVTGFRCNFQGEKKDHGVEEVSVSGGPSALAFSTTETVSGNMGSATQQYTFRGALDGNTITGTLSYQLQDQSPPLDGLILTASGSMTIPVTLQR